MTEPHCSLIFSNKRLNSGKEKKSIFPPILRAITSILATIIFFSLITSSSAEEMSPISPISVNKNGDFGDTASTAVSISSDGRVIFFTSHAENLINTGGTNHLYMYDRNTLGLDAITGSISSSEISGDGRVIAYTKKGQSDVVNLLDLLDSKRLPKKFLLSTESVDSQLTIIAVSHKGRYLLISSSPAFPDSNDSTSGISGIWFADRITGHTKRISNLSKIDPKVISLSDDGRIVAFLEDSPDTGFEEKRIIIFNRVLDQETFLELPNFLSKQDIQIQTMDLSRNGNIMAFNVARSNGHYSILTYNRTTDQYQEIQTFSSGSDNSSSGLSLSNDGRYIAVLYQTEENLRILSRFNIETGEEIIIDKGEISSPIDITANGNSILFNKFVSGISQVFIWHDPPEWDPTYIVAGRVTDSLGTPLGLVNIDDARGNKTRTDHDGFFWINGFNAGLISIIPEKEGFIFDPESFKGKLESDMISINFTSDHDAVLTEGEKDLGMPYNQNRGNLGSFHGFSAGYCTDLILDAYSWGAEFNISLAIEMDFKASPDHFYRWRNARDAHDMWRYFSYSGQMHSHKEKYLPGDIVFFDWSRDGEIDHVALVSQVDIHNRPEMMFDATGVINSNPEGLAAELPWEGFHEDTVRGFARWSGLYEPMIQDFPTGNIFQIAFGGSELEIRLLDATGKAISGEENEIQGGVFHNLIWEQSLSISGLGDENKYYLILARNPSETHQPFLFTAQFLQDGLVTQRFETKGVLEPGKISSFPIKVDIFGDGSTVMQLLNNNRRVAGFLRVH